MLASKYGVEKGRVELVFISADVDCAHHFVKPICSCTIIVDHYPEWPNSVNMSNPRGLVRQGRTWPEPSTPLDQPDRHGPPRRPVDRLGARPCAAGLTGHHCGAAGSYSMARVREIGYMEENLEKQEIIGSISPLFVVGRPGVMGTVVKDQTTKLQKITKGRNS
ncbi:hypothetical protein BR93DRAFT_178241 [Coniochaeta sp. PMI_546]|nr:hypothetical protein BR93DRAFT_178241 [Coniochaeta sp. PMI_546]